MISKREMFSLGWAGSLAAVLPAGIHRAGAQTQHAASRMMLGFGAGGAIDVVVLTAWIVRPGMIARLVAGTDQTLAERLLAGDKRALARAISLVSALAARWSMSNAETLAALDEFYGDKIFYHGKYVSRQAVLSEKKMFAEHWPPKP